MIILPAIDLKDGKVVRLYKGDYNKQTTYSDQPVEIAKTFEKMGADYLHLVDLNGAKEGQCINKEVIESIRERITMPIELGGGIRDEFALDMYLNQIKIDRVILGTAALKDRPFLEKALKQYGPEKIVVGVDIKNGCVATQGWLNESDIPYLVFLKELEKMGVKYVVVTDISKDGTLTGPNFELYETIASHTTLNVVVSGGISCKDDILRVHQHYGCIVGKAYYDGKVDLEEVITCLKKESFPV